MQPWIISGVVAFGLGAVLRVWDQRSPTGGRINPRRLTPLQVLYTCLFAYPFCLAYVLLERAL